MVSVFRQFSLAIVAAVFLAGCSSSGNAGFAASSVPVTDGTASDFSAEQLGSLKLVQTLPAPLNTENGTNQLIYPNDVLQVDVFQVDDLDRTAQVNSAGRISLPLIGDVQAAGRSISELENNVKGLYGSKYLRNPDITISMKESVGQRVTVDGEFRTAGIYPTSAQSTLIQVIAQAKGFTSIGDPDKVYVFRNYGSEQFVAQFNATKIRAGQAPDPRIFGGDVVVAFPSGMRVLGSNLREAFGLVGGARNVIP